MLKYRIIGMVLVRDGIAVQGIGFKRYLPVGKPEIAIDFLNKWGVDEIVVLNIDRKNKVLFPDEKISLFARQCQVPLAIGGGIHSVSDVGRIIRAGADKVVINSSLITAPEIISKARDLYGEQSIIASIDASRCGDEYCTFINSGTQQNSLAPDELARHAEILGAGEIMVTSIDNDGSRNGYDIRLLQSVCNAVGKPVIACGGAGHPKHILEAITAGAKAVAVGNAFHFSEHSVTLYKRYLKQLSLPVRLDSYCHYENALFDDHARLLKQDDAVLEEMRFQYISEEVI